MAAILMAIWKNLPKENEVSGCMNQKSKSKTKIEKPLWETIKDHILMTKGSITSKSFEVFLTNLTHS